jgi:ribose-phosphate pyrophosphokinase
MKNNSIIFGLSGTEILYNEVKKHLNEFHSYNLHNNFGTTNYQKFSDGEISVDLETSVRGKKVFLLTNLSNSDKILELEFAIDASRRAGAKEIIPIITYFAYARSDKKDYPRGSISAKVIASKLEFLGATSVITFDLHAEQIEGFFQIPVIHMHGKYLFESYIKECGLNNLVLAAPDAGGGKRVKHYRDLIKLKYNIELPIVFMDKTRSQANVVDKMIIIGDVEGKDVIIIDDLADTCGTICKGAGVLLDEGKAKSVKAIVTHGVLSGNAYDTINNSKLEAFLCSNSLNVIEGNKIKIISLYKQISKGIIAIDKGLSIENLNNLK